MAPKKKGFNKYQIKGDITELYETNKKGENFIIFIDTSDLQKLIDLDYHWHIGYSIKGWNYARATVYVESVNKKAVEKIYYLHKLLLGIANLGKKIHVDHENHNTLDNRRDNLRVILAYNNKRSRKGPNKNNKSGYRNVSWNDTINKWVIQFQVNGRNTIVATGDNLDETGKLANELRPKYYGEYSGVG